MHPVNTPLTIAAVRALSVAFLVLVLAPQPRAAKNRFDIVPGPPAISPEERAIVADASTGVEHGVILVEETLRDENRTFDYETLHHLRAKILSNEARDLANIEIPLVEGGEILDWWAMTLLPDGTVLEVRKGELKEQTLLKARGLKISAMKAALPGVVPGCVIDYGYRITQPDFERFEQIPVQGRWPIRLYRYVWIPYGRLQGAYRIKLAEKLDLGVTVDRNRVIVEGRNLPAVREEPMMPPYYEVSSSFYTYYVSAGTDFDDYWKDMANSYDRVIKQSYRRGSVKQALERINPAPEGTLHDKLRAIYDWMAANAKSTSLRTFEEIREDDGDDKERKDSVRQILESGEGSAWDVRVAFIALARAVGADAWIVFVSDRTENYFDEALKTLRQFDTQVVAVGAPGTPADKLTMVDPASGLDFGRIPWWVTGNRGLLARAKVGGPILLPGATAEENRADVRVNVHFEEDNELSVVKWDLGGTGQVGLLERRYLRRLSPGERAERIDELCGASATMEIVNAEMKGLEDLTERYKLSCEAEAVTDLTAKIGHYQFSWSGPWMDSVPDLPEGDRAHNILFRYPHLDVARITVQAPEGFVPLEAPPDQRLQGPASGYVVEYKKTESGYEVVRQMMVRGVGLPRSDYQAFRDFMEQVRQADRQPLTFVRSGPGS